MSPTPVTFGSVKSLIIISITFYLCVMFYFHTRLSKEDLRISRLEQIARKGGNLPGGVHVDRRNLIKFRAGNITVKLSKSRDHVFQSGRRKKGPPTAKFRRRNKNKNEYVPEQVYEGQVRARQGRNNRNQINKKRLENAKTATLPPPTRRRRTTTKRLTIFNMFYTKQKKKHLPISPTVKGRIIGALVATEKLSKRVKADSNKGKHQTVLKMISSGKNARRNGNFHEIMPDVFVYSAFLDERVGRYLRFVSIANRLQTDSPTQFMCHFRSGYSSVGKFYRTCEDHMKLYAAYVISCPVPEAESSQSIFKNGVKVSNSSDIQKGYFHVRVVVHQMTTQKRQFNICIPPLFGNVAEDKLIEFVEASKIFGADHFTFYREYPDLNANLTKVLNMYVQSGAATMLPWRLPIESTEIWYHGQSVSVWDCLFRNMHEFDFIAFNDLDEFIVPKVTKTWKTMIDILKKSEKDANKIAALRFQSAEFDNSRAKDIPSFSEEIKKLKTLNTIWRNERTDTIRTKMIVDPSKVFELGIHHLSKPISNKYRALNVDPKIALLHHYKPCEDRPRRSCRAFVKDVSFWRYYPELVDRVRKIKSLLKNITQRTI